MINQKWQIFQSLWDTLIKGAMEFCVQEASNTATDQFKTLGKAHFC